MNYTLSYSCVKIVVNELMHSYHDAEKFIGYCKECDRYNACWACPPFDFNADEYLAPYKIAYIIGTKIVLDRETINKYQGFDECKNISYKIMKDTRKSIDGNLLELEKQYLPSKAFFAGSCQICKEGECMRATGKPCISPERVRPSLESLGFDVSLISAELLNIEMKWSKNGILPEYFTLVSGFFSVDEILSTHQLLLDGNRKTNAICSG
jgi:predicted metal-binding protein